MSRAICGVVSCCAGAPLLDLMACPLRVLHKDYDITKHAGLLMGMLRRTMGCSSLIATPSQQRRSKAWRVQSRLIGISAGATARQRPCSLQPPLSLSPSLASMAPSPRVQTATSGISPCQMARFNFWIHTYSPHVCSP